MNLKVKLMRAADQKKLKSGEERENLTQTEKLGGSLTIRLSKADMERLCSILMCTNLSSAAVSV